jgi:hypothetical protein
MFIEFEKQERSETEQVPNARNPQQPYQSVHQPALLFRDGEKYPDKFNYRLYFGTDLNKANAAQPMPVGKYELKETAYGVDQFKNINTDYSELQPVKQPSARAA